MALNNPVTCQKDSDQFALTQRLIMASGEWIQNTLAVQF